MDGKFIECIRRVIREEIKVAITYRDLKDQLTQRVIWPFALAFYDQALIVVAWCELRQDFRHFRADRVESWSDTRTDYPRHRLDLLREWQNKERIPLQKYDL
jgi:predicted DNA-binding transcriptional regulator YafY